MSPVDEGPIDEELTIPAPEAAYSTPIDAPLSGPPPGRFRDGEVLTVQYRSDPAAIRRLLPEPLVPTNDTVMVQVARWGDVAGLGRNTYEANVMVGARLGDLTGSYSPYFWVTSDRAMVGGREFHGQPKRIGTVTLEHRGDLVVGTVANNGIEIFTGTLPYKAAPSSFDELCRRVDIVTNINLKIVHHIDGRTAIRQLTARDLTDIEVNGCWTGPSTAEIRPNATSPLYRLPVLGYLEGFYWYTEFSLVGGRAVSTSTADMGAVPQVSLLLDQRYDHPEGLVWDARGDRLLWIDIFAGLVMSYDLRSARPEVTDLGRPVGAVAPRRAGGLVCAVREGFGLLAEDGAFSLVTDQLRAQPHLQMNDGAVDERGRFWAGTTCLAPDEYPDAGVLYCLRPESSEASEELHGVNVSNGIGWSPDGRRCYYVDTATSRVDCFAFDPNVGAISERRLLAEVESVPDGLAVDADGCVWVAMCGGWEVQRFTPEGRLDRTVRLPGSLVTTCAFGGPDLATLFIAVSARGLDEQSLRSEKAGCIFAFEPGVQGLPAHEYLG